MLNEISQDSVSVAQGSCTEGKRVVSYKNHKVRKYANLQYSLKMKNKISPGVSVNMYFTYRNACRLRQIKAYLQHLGDFHG